MIWGGYERIWHQLSRQNLAENYWNLQNCAQVFLPFSDCVLSLGLCSQSCHVMQYLADFKIGEQDIAGIVDPGSFECLVRSARCQHCGCQMSRSGKHIFFCRQQSILLCID